MSKKTIAAVCAIALTLPLAGCGTDPLAQMGSGNQGFISGDGSTTSIPQEKRSGQVQFHGIDAAGNTHDYTDYAGSVTVINFWYAGCAPCRAEIGDLTANAVDFQGQVKFLGVNTRDQAAQVTQFEQEFQVPYSSIVDASAGRETQAAFAKQVPLNAVPTTVVLDTEGRVAHRVVGQLAGKSQLRTLIRETLAESADK